MAFVGVELSRRSERAGSGVELLVLALIGDGWADCGRRGGPAVSTTSTISLRIEIEAALKRGAPVAPVDVDDAKVLREADFLLHELEGLLQNDYNLRTAADSSPRASPRHRKGSSPDFTALAPRRPESQPQPAKTAAAPAVIRPAPVAPKPASRDPI